MIQDSLQEHFLAFVQKQYQIDNLVDWMDSLEKDLTLLNREMVCVRIFAEKDPGANPYYSSNARLKACVNTALSLIQEKSLQCWNQEIQLEAEEMRCALYGGHGLPLEQGRDDLFSNIPMARDFAYARFHTLFRLNRIAGGHRTPIRSDTEIDLTAALLPGITRQEFLAVLKRCCIQNNVKWLPLDGPAAEQ